MNDFKKNFIKKLLVHNKSCQTMMFITVLIKQDKFINYKVNFIQNTYSYDLSKNYSERGTHYH